MKNNTLYIIVVVLVVITAGCFVFYRTSSQNVEEAPVNTAPQGKLDINAVCEGALAYMSFPDGASAEAFVAECKDGKRPEVIERYKAQLNLDGAAI
jgi:hypothetical protein